MSTQIQSPFSPIDTSSIPDQADVAANTAHAASTANPHLVEEDDAGSRRIIRDAIPVTGNDTVRARFAFDKSVRIVDITIVASTAPVTAGTYTLTATRTADAKNILAAANFDLTSLVSGTWTSITLAAADIDKELAINAEMYIDFISNNGDLAAEGVYLRVIAQVI